MAALPRWAVIAISIGLSIGLPWAAPAPAPAGAQPVPASDELARLRARTDAVAREVSRLRGLPLKRPIPTEVIDRDELRRRIVQLAAEDKAKGKAASEGLALARWGMIPLAVDHEALLVELLSEQIAGFYDPDTKQLTLSRRAAPDEQAAELVLAHEIEHGLQDQAFDLKQLGEVPDGEDDARAARRALVEGDGMALMVELMVARAGAKMPWANPQATEAIERAMVVPGEDAIDRAPLAIREALLFPYRAGFAFVAALRRRQPWSAVDAAFARPPRSTEQVLHPERYLADDRPVPIVVDPPASLRGFARAHETVWGELGFQLFLRSHGIDAATAASAAAGWGGDRAMVLSREGDPRPVRAAALSRSEWDSEADAIEAQEAAVKALDAAILGAVVEHALTRTRWLALDGTSSWVERRGPSLVIVHGAPAWAAAALSAEVWTATRIAKPPAPKPAAKPRAPKPAAAK